MVLLIKKLHPDAIIPKYIREGDAAFDLYSKETIIIPPNERRLISTGIMMAIPSGHVGLIWDRSGLAAKNGIKTMGGVIDHTYRGEVKVILHNLSLENFQVEKGLRIAQMLIQPVVTEKIEEVQELETNTTRGTSGFGSSGLR